MIDLKAKKSVAKICLKTRKNDKAAHKISAQRVFQCISSLQNVVGITLLTFSKSLSNFSARYQLSILF